MRRSIIVAMAENGVIGNGNDLPWSLPDDLKRFRRLTLGHHVIMGRKTCEAIGKLLPDRKMIVLTRQKDWTVPWGSVQTAASLDEAFDLAGGDDESFVIGGGEIYRLAMPLVDRIYLTRIHGHFEGDATFPLISHHEWNCLASISGESQALKFTYEIYDRAPSDYTQFCHLLGEHRKLRETELGFFKARNPAVYNGVQVTNRGGIGHPQATSAWLFDCYGKLIAIGHYDPRTDKG